MSNIAVRTWNGLDGLINDKPFMPWASPEQQAEVLMELAEQDGERLGGGERRLILEYARAVRDYHKVRDLVDELSDVSFELRHGLLEAPFLLFRYAFYAVAAAGKHLPLSDAADRAVFIHKGDVEEIVDVAEDAHAREAAHPGDEREADVAVLPLEIGVDRLEDIAESVMGLRVVKIGHQWLVILVNKNHCLMTRLLHSGLYQPGEPLGKPESIRLKPVNFLPSGKLELQCFFQSLYAVAAEADEVEVEDRMRRPVMLVSLYGKTLEQLALSLEIGLYCTEQQTLPEPPWAAQEIILAACYETVDQLGLVDIYVSLLSQFLKCLYPYRELLIIHSISFLQK